jgi:hypothetical protein
MTNGDSARFLTEWHRVVAERDLAALPRLLAPDVTLGAPPYWQRLEGERTVGHLLGLILQTIDGFTYHREWVQGAELALEFSGHVEQLELQGIDLITLDASGRVRNLDVLMRPVNAVLALRDRIAPQMVRFLSGAAVEPR